MIIRLHVATFLERLYKLWQELKPLSKKGEVRVRLDCLLADILGLVGVNLEDARLYGIEIGEDID